MTRQQNPFQKRLNLPAQCRLYILLPFRPSLFLGTSQVRKVSVYQLYIIFLKL